MWSSTIGCLLGSSSLFKMALKTPTSTCAMAKTQRHRCLHRCHERQRRLQTAWRSAPQFGCCHFSFRDWVCQDWKSLQLVLIPGMTFIYINFMFIYIFILLYINIYIYIHTYSYYLMHFFYIGIICVSSVCPSFFDAALGPNPSVFNPSWWSVHPIHPP